MYLIDYIRLSFRLMTPFVQHQFALTRAKAVFYSGLVFTVQGAIAIVQQFSVKFLSRRLVGCYDYFKQLMNYHECSVLSLEESNIKQACVLIMIIIISYLYRMYTCSANSNTTMNAF